VHTAHSGIAHYTLYKSTYLLTYFTDKFMMRFLQMVASSIRICLRCNVLPGVLCVNASLLHAAILQPDTVLTKAFMGRFVTGAAVSYYHGWKLVFRKFARVVDSIYKHYADRICVLAMAKPTADDLRRLDDVCAVCGTAMDADSSRLTPCGHAFRGNCLELCVRVLPHCPLCRHQLIT